MRPVLVGAMLQLSTLGAAAPGAAPSVALTEPTVRIECGIRRCGQPASPGLPGHPSPVPRRSAPLHAGGSVVTDSFWSQALGIRKQLVLWLPPSYRSDRTRRYPVAYYLHGAWGSETDWTQHGALASTFDSLVTAGMPEVIVVMPDGDDGMYTTWNFLGDWPGCRRKPLRTNEAPERYCVPWPHYDDYIARDLVSYIDGHYRTRADRTHRGIAGLSMGGYGAVSLTMRFPDVFGAAASHSGVLAPLLGVSPAGNDTAHYARDIAEARKRYPPEFWPILEPAFGKDIAGWMSRDPLQLAKSLIARGQNQLAPIYVDCGNADALLAQSRYFARAAGALGLSVTYTEWPGEHNWDYWRAHLASSATWLAAHIAGP